MNSIANNVAAKFFVVLTAVAMVFTLVTPAKAQSTEDLQKMINDLLAQVASLQGQLGGGSNAGSGVCPYTWTRTLASGATGADVMKLQQFLNSDSETRVSASGVGSAGMETEYFGPATGAAVSKFQTKYRSEILSPAGLVNPTGTFGPATMKKANALCAQAGGADDSDDDMSDDDSDDDMSDDDMSDDDDDTSDGPLSGEASLDTFEINEGDDVQIEEGQEDAPVAEFDVEFSDGDAMITRIDIALDAQGTEEDPWDTFDEVSLWVDGDEVAREDASDEDEYLDEDDGSIRFSGLDIVAREDEEVTIVVGVSVQGSVDNLDATWDVSGEAIRFLDGDDVSTTEDDVDELGDTSDFEIQEEGSDDELTVKSSSEDPDATTIKVEDDEKSDFTTIFAFNLDSEDSVNDITVDGLTVSVVTPSDAVGDVVSDAQLVIGSQTFDDYTMGSTTAATSTFVFDLDEELVIEAGDEVTAEFQVEFKQLTGNFDEGEQISASTTADTIDAEGADDLTVVDNQLSGGATGETHTLRTQGAILEPGDVSETFKENNDTSTTDNEGVFVIEFDVTAFENDLYIDDTAASGTVENNTGVNYIITVGGSTIVTGTRVADLDSSADLDGTRFKVNEGETETFTLTVEFDPSTATDGEFHKVQLYSVNWNDTNADADTQQLALPAEDYDTDALAI